MTCTICFTWPDQIISKQYIYRAARYREQIMIDLYMKPFDMYDIHMFGLFRVPSYCEPHTYFMIFHNAIDFRQLRTLYDIFYSVFVQYS